MKLCVEKSTNFMINWLNIQDKEQLLFSQTKLETLANQKRSADRTFGNTALENGFPNKMNDLP